MLVSTDDRKKLSQGTDISLSKGRPPVRDRKWSDESEALMINSRHSSYDDRLESDLSVSSSRLPTRERNWSLESSQPDALMNTSSHSSYDERRAPASVRSNRRPPVCERRWEKKYTQAAAQMIIGHQFSYDERKLERTISRRDTISTVSSSCTSINGLRRNDTIASDSSYSGTREQMDALRRDDTIASDSSYSGTREQVDALRRDDTITSDSSCSGTREHVDASNSLDDVLDIVSSSEKTTEEPRQLVSDRLYNHGISQLKKIEQMREEDSSQKKRVKPTNRRKSNIPRFSDRLYNLSKEKQEYGKKRREAIARANTKRYAIPTKEDFGVIPMSQAANMYNKGVKLLHEKKTKLKEAKLKLEGNNDFGTIPLDQSDNMYVKGVQSLRQKQFDIARKQELSQIKALLLPEASIANPKSTPFLSDMERKYLLLQRRRFPRCPSARTIRDNSSKSLKAVTVREEIAQLIELEVGEIGVKFSVESFEKLCRIALRE